MARIRTVKPEFWQDEKMAPLPPIDRLVFLGLVSQADDAGRLLDNVKLLDGLLFPHTDDTCRESIETLTRIGRVRRYESDSGQSLLQITNWKRHQRVVNPSKHTLPPPPPQPRGPQHDPESSLGSSESLNTPSLEPKPPTLDHGPGSLEHGTGSVAIATGADAPPNGTPPSRPEPPPIDRIDDREQRRSAYLQTFMPVLREVGLHDDGTNGSIIKALADKRAPPTGMEEAIRGLALVMPGEMPGGELKLLYATKRDDIAEPMWNRAKRAYTDSIKGEVSPLVREMTG